MFAESKGFKYFKNAYYGVAKYFGNIFWLIDDVIAINDEKKNKIWKTNHVGNRDYFCRPSSVYKWG